MHYMVYSAADRIQDCLFVFFLRFVMYINLLYSYTCIILIKYYIYLSCNICIIMQSIYIDLINNSKKLIETKYHVVL